MRLPLGFGTLDFSNWFYGLWAAVVGGGSTAVVGAVVLGSKDAYYSLGSPQSLSIMWWIFLTAAAWNFFNYLAKHPAPERVVETTVKTVEKPTSGEVVTTTVKEVHTEPASQETKR